MEVLEHEVIRLKVADIKLDSENPNQLTKEQMQGLQKSLRKFGYVHPIVVDENNLVADGEHRLQVAKQLGMKEVPAYRVKFANDVERRLFRQTMNKLRGEHDRKLDADEYLKIFQGGQLSELAELLARPQEEFQRALEKHHGIEFVKEDDFDVEAELQKPAITKTGDVWQLGRHRLMCGDSTKPQDIDLVIRDREPNLVLTDPPYNIGFGYNDFKDEQSNESYKEMLRSVFANTSAIPKKIITPGPRNLSLWLSIKNYDDIGVWVKKNATAGASAFNLRLCEPILFYGKFEKRTTDLFEYSSGFPAELTDARAVHQLHKTGHAPTKPLKLWADLIESYSALNDVILDCFMGNGTTLIACEQSDRTAIGLELDPKYCDVICARFKALTGIEPKLISPTPSETVQNG